MAYSFICPGNSYITKVEGSRTEDGISWLRFGCSDGSASAPLGAATTGEQPQWVDVSPYGYSSFGNLSFGDRLRTYELQQPDGVIHQRGGEAGPIRISSPVCSTGDVIYWVAGTTSGGKIVDIYPTCRKPDALSGGQTPAGQYAQIGNISTMPAEPEVVPVVLGPVAEDPDPNPAPIDIQAPVYVPPSVPVDVETPNLPSAPISVSPSTSQWNEPRSANQTWLVALFVFVVFLAIAIGWYVTSRGLMASAPVASPGTK